MQNQKMRSRLASIPADYARPKLPCVGTGAKALQRHHCGVKRSQEVLAGL